jgi:sugar phosphate isomerase/epimerase
MLPVGYATNVHPGRNLAELRASLLGPASEIARLVDGGPLPLGVWLSAETVRQLSERPEEADRLRDDLRTAGLLIGAVNAFPYGNFAAERVKTGVYEPNWANARRALYTLAAAELLPRLVPEGTPHVSMSTLPLGWRPRFSAEGCGASVGLAAAQLEQVARGLARLEDRSGLRVTLDIEPEPGCAIQTFDELCGFMGHCLRPRREEPCLERHLGACVDLCHAAVMGESPEHPFRACAASGLGVHRVQVSAALRGQADAASLAALAQFDESRWLHQVVTGTSTEPRVWEDIPDFLGSNPTQPWRCHFHVPVFMSEMLGLATTADSLPVALAQIRSLSGPCFVEVETYAWSRLPQRASHGWIEGIAREILHVRGLLANGPVSAQPCPR